MSSNQWDCHAGVQRRTKNRAAISTSSGNGEDTIEDAHGRERRSVWSPFSGDNSDTSIHNTATSRAMIDALLRLFEDGVDCCHFYQTITSRYAGHLQADNAEYDQDLDNDPLDILSMKEPIQGLNHSQSAAVHSYSGPLSLIWGPPGLLFCSTNKYCIDVPHRHQ